MAAFSCGVILLYWVGVIPPSSALVGGVVVAALFGIVTRRANPALLLGCFLAGLAWAAWQADARLERRLPAELEGQTLRVSGYLCGLPTEGAFASVRFDLCVQRWHDTATGLRPGGKALPRKLKLAWYGRDAHRYIPQTVNLVVSLKRPHGSANPAGFGYEGWLFRHGFGATGTVRELTPATDVRCGPRCAYHQWRGGLARALQARWGNLRSFPLVQSLLIGERGALNADHWRVFKATGTIHLVAISGLHLGLIALGAGWLASRLLLRLPAHWSTPSRSRLLVFAAVMAASLVYALAAGFAVPTRRALIMIAVAGWVLLCGRQVSVWLGLLLALAITLLTDPFSPLDRGFWLSFAAVAVLVLVFSRRAGRPGPVRGVIVAQLAVFVGLGPVLAFMDQPPVVMGVLANLVAVPWVSVVVMPLLLLGALIAALLPALTPWVGLGFEAVLTPLWWTLERLADAPAPAWSPTRVEVLVLTLPGLLALLYPGRGFRRAVMAWVVLWAVTGAGRHAGNTTVTHPELWVWDVGQGLSVLLRDENQVLVYDTGPEYPSGYAAVTGVLLPNYRRLGVRHIDQLVISHGDLDHAGGLPQLQAALTVGVAYSGEPARLAKYLPGALACPVGTRSWVGRVELSFWRDYPPPGERSSNNASCVVVARYGAVRVILPGDISRGAEERLLKVLDADPGETLVVVAAHHGSQTSSGKLWVETLRPAAVVYSAGYRHRFGHPHPDVVARYQGVASRSFNTALTGGIQFRLSRDGFTVHPTRARVPFWMRASPP
ncbi:DNA internalization-related competence protein ComEC/Rec2 [Marinobacter sp. X15-166B]|uniref:DNA internalization-related competence protein ComEC/Rec2 n=1 Tax=Marinobacter sp. X15-166B TaxID=1897620 RepID=UPI00085BCADC|nr:DNA internalization-related competence protein ComEC/Rec2 [Marinobacter sp. X15-166B]OEY67220.1 DNA internalization-related competence protein ComEC/Rec2 [Marinobacter sp. X15-166B]